MGAGASGVVAAVGAASVRRNRMRSTTYSTTRTTASTGAMTSAKPAKVRSRWGMASRFVRFETGSSREAELTIRRQA